MVSPDGMLAADSAEELLVDFVTVDSPVDGFQAPGVEVRLLGPREATLAAVGAGAGFLGVIHAADDEGDLDGAHFALQYGEVVPLGVACSSRLTSPI